MFYSFYPQNYCRTITTHLQPVSVSLKLFPSSQLFKNFSPMIIRENGSIFTPAYCNNGGD